MSFFAPASIYLASAIAARRQARPLAAEGELAGELESEKADAVVKKAS